jgi:hypothetical protein
LFWKTILDVARNGNDAFRDVVEQARRDLNMDCRLKDDDVALVIIRVGEEFPTWIDSSDWKYNGPNIATFVEEQSNQQSKFAELLNVVPAPVIAESNTSPLGQSEPVLRTNEPADVFQNCRLPQPHWRSIIAYIWEMLSWRKAGNSKQEQALPSPAAGSTATDTAPTVTH